jgi:phage recombination protein Bet
MGNSTALTQVAKRLQVSEHELQNIVMNTVMPNGGKQVTNEQFVSFMAVANEYRLNPLVKEIYAYPAKGGGIQPVVSIDGWLKIINSNPDFNGMTFQDNRENGKLISITCRIYKKGIEHPVEVTEYLAECFRPTEPWKTMESRMLRHKSTIQAGRYAFGISGIIDPDEAERFKDAGVIEKEVNPAPQQEEKQLPVYTQEQFNDNVEAWAKAIESGRVTPERVIATVTSKYSLPDDIRQQIETLSEGEAA